MEEKLYLNPEEILRHEFKIDARGSWSSLP